MSIPPRVVLPSVKAAGRPCQRKYPGGPAFARVMMVAAPRIANPSTSAAVIRCFRSALPTVLPATIVGGLFLFLSFSFGGCMVRHAGQRKQRITAALVLGLAILGAATIITRANAGPPGYLRWQGLPAALTEGRTTRGGIDIVVVPEGSTIKLIVPLRKTSRTPGEE